MEEGTRFSGADWADQKKMVYVIGAGGIGSWLCLNLSRIGHDVIVYDGDTVDATNVNGGQMYRTSDVGLNKAEAIHEVCRLFGASSDIISIANMFDANEESATRIMISCVDNMQARKDIFTLWKSIYSEDAEAIFIDGRLLMESMEVFCVRGTDVEAIKKYEEEHLFSDDEVAQLDCTTKQSTFSAMTIAGIMTACLCNHLTNIKLEMVFREVPFYQRLHFPIFEYKTVSVENVEV